MTLTGSMPLAKFQLGREAVPGTAVAATKKIPIMSGNLNEHADRTFPHEQRESLVANYRSFATKRYVEISGMEIAPTYELLPVFLNYAISCNTAGTPTAVVAKRYDFMPNPTVDDLATGTLEVGEHTQEFQVPFAIMTRLELTIPKNAPATLTCDWLGQKATASSFTSNLADLVLEDINGATGAAYIDASGGTIGSTANTNVMECKVTVDTKQTQFWGFNGDLFPVDVYRSDSRSAAVEMKIAFNSASEYTTYQANMAATGSTQRKIRYTTTGSAISGTTPATSKSLTVDLYTVWEEAPFGDEDGLRVVNFKGQTQWNTSALTDFKFSVINDGSVTAL